MGREPYAKLLVTSEALDKKRLSSSKGRGQSLTAMAVLYIGRLSQACHKLATTVAGKQHLVLLLLVLLFFRLLCFFGRELRFEKVLGWELGVVREVFKETLSAFLSVHIEMK